MPRSDKWQLVGVAGLGMSAVGSVMGHTGWARGFWLAVALFPISCLSWDLYVKRRKRRARRQALLTHLGRLMRDELRRR
ncbi:hypothetical protein [Streptomyces fractus]|uniref:hypothetical protein n=1 Tax=Streptomyces fractus TaxID=641806 RepID=UPI003CF47085